ncbi:hypothetical protein VTK73DRAFT_8989 [Phialemonium thermophilum]|uniref:Zf-CHY-domain-containing protein n=1 Tax=Phialemonium thermophilum TaxID=223376 RepID=A0ABR3XN43_9PEZI
MPSLVSSFIINPVLRQARRFSSGPLTEVEADEPQQHSDATTFSVSTTPTTQPDHSVLPTMHIPLISRTVSEYDAERGASTEGSESQTPDGAPSGRSQRVTLSPDGGFLEAVPSTAAYKTQMLLPEDDGMGVLRRRIHAIQSRDISSQEKARLMHDLLMEGYTRSQIASQSKVLPRTEAFLSSTSTTAGPLQTLNKFLTHLGEGSNPLKVTLTEEDLQPTFAPHVPSEEDAFETSNIDNDMPSEGEDRRLGCRHYFRNVKMQCATCERWYTCRFCHDSAEDHVLPRRETKNMLCMLCGCAQRASDTCLNCGESAARYYCSVCKLWNDDPNKPIYHCHDCGICRVGQGLGKDFFHCNKCMACISIAVSTTHKCIERSTDCDCPICGDYMFSSPRQVVFMQCGHSIHRDCYEEHLKTSYRCPICNKSVMNMETQFRNFDIAVATQPMPPEYKDARAKILCNDCRAKSQTAYHWLGLKCSICSSYNTVQLELLNMPHSHGDGGGADGRGVVGAIELPVETGPSSSVVLAQDAYSAGNDAIQQRMISPHRRDRNLLPRASAASPSVCSSENLARSSSPAELVTTFGGPSSWSGFTAETTESEEEEDALDFWGGDDYPAIATAESAVEDDESDDDGSDFTDDCDADSDTDDDDDDLISLLGHP